jgi:hypothetical protein
MTAGSKEEGMYERLAALPLEIEGYATRRHERPVSSGFTRVTTEVMFYGGGEVGSGEDVTYDADDHDAFPTGFGLGWAGTLGGFLSRFEGRALFPRQPRRDASHEHRRWAFESAALDLALRENGLSLGEAVGRAYAPVRFVVSTRLDIRPWLEIYPDLEFKLDPTAEWDRKLMTEIGRCGCVRVLDFKAYYTGTPVDVTPDAKLYRAVAKAFPEAILEDPSLEDDCGKALRPARERLSFDAPIHSWADVEALPLSPRYLNVKPSRFGSLQRLFEFIERAQAAGITLYGGGQFELGPGRDQIQALASLFYADAPNDVAPMGYNEPEAQKGLRTSPLAPSSKVVGFEFGGS